MAIKRRQNKLQDLAASGIVTNRISGSIPFEYSGPNSPLFTVSEIPNPAPQGKSSFLIAGTELLKNRPCYYKRVHAGFKPGISDSPTWHNFSERNNTIRVWIRTPNGEQIPIPLNLHATQRQRQRVHVSVGAA